MMLGDSAIEFGDRTIHGLDFKLTCEACPEQYDIFKDGVEVGYLRLRYGHFRTWFPGCPYGHELDEGFHEKYKCVHEGDVGTEWTGEFPEEVREAHLTAAAAAINAAMAAQAVLDMEVPK